MPSARSCATPRLSMVQILRLVLMLAFSGWVAMRGSDSLLRVLASLLQILRRLIVLLAFSGWVVVGSVVSRRSALCFGGVPCRRRFASLHLNIRKSL